MCVYVRNPVLYRITTKAKNAIVPASMESFVDRVDPAEVELVESDEDDEDDDEEVDEEPAAVLDPLP